MGAIRAFLRQPDQALGFHLAGWGICLRALILRHEPLPFSSQKEGRDLAGVPPQMIVELGGYLVDAISKLGALLLDVDSMRQSEPTG